MPAQKLLSRLVFFILLLIGLTQSIFAQGTCLEFSNTESDRVEIPDESAFDFTTSMTVECWINVTSFTTNWQAIVTKGDNSWRLQRYNDTDSLCFHLTNVHYLNGSTSVNDGQWHHVAGTFDGSEMCLYIDGNLDASYATGGTIANSNYPVWIGGNAGVNGRSFNGKIDEVRIWDYAKSQTEIQNDMYNYDIDNTHPHWTNLVGYWKFDEGSGQTAGDSSSNSHDGTLGSSSSVESEDPSWQTSDAPLPVELSYFTCNFTNGYNHLEWVTESETNNSGWNIYRNLLGEISSANKINSQLIEAYGNSTSHHTYHYNDESNLIQNRTYYYWLESVDYSGSSHFYGPTRVTIEENNNNVPSGNMIYGLQQNYPNPFNPITSIKFVLKKSGNVQLEVFDLRGQKVATLFKGFVEADRSIIKTWDAKNVSSGVYFYKLTTDEKTYIKKALLLK